MNKDREGLLAGLRADLPRMGRAGSRSATLHAEAGTRDRRFDVLPVDETAPKASIAQLRYFFALRWTGTLGALLIAFGGLGAGALPVVGNPYDNLPFGALASRMLQSSSALVFVGVGFVVLAWVLMAGFMGTPLPLPLRGARAPRHSFVTTSHLWRTWAGWVIPLIPTAPLFTQDIYSYLANGSILRAGLDPYSAGPVQLLGTEHPLARSVPFIWANSPSPYGPVSLGIAKLVSAWTDDSIVAGVIAHRCISLVGIIAAGWALMALARRCRVAPTTALWLGMLNPLAILHLVGGIHNEAILLGLVLAGMELGLRGLDRLGTPGLSRAHHWAWPFIASGVLLSCAGMVKVTGFIGLGFTGMALARCWWLRRGWSQVRAVGLAAAVQIGITMASIAAVTVLTGINTGWITGQGGAASIRSWLSISTDVGVIAGFGGMLLGLGDHTEAMLLITRAAGLAVAAAFMVRMLFATLRGAIHPVGGLGVGTLALVIFFPVVHPWYILWAIFPLAAWANRYVFRAAVVGYSVPMSFVVLPRGLGLPPHTVAVIYLAAALTFAVCAAGWRVLLRRYRVRGLD